MYDNCDLRRLKINNEDSRELEIINLNASSSAPPTPMPKSVNTIPSDDDDECSDLTARKGHFKGWSCIHTVYWTTLERQ